MRRAGPLEALLTALLTKNPEDRLSASRVRIWLRWLVNVAHSAPPSEILPTKGLGGTIPHPPAPPSPVPQPAKTPMAAMATATTGPLEVPASDPATPATQEPPEGLAPRPSRPLLPPAPPVPRRAGRRLLGMAALLLVGGMLTAWSTGAFQSDPTRNRAAPVATSQSLGVSPAEDQSARATPRSGVGATGTTRPAPPTTKEPASTQARTTRTTAAPTTGLPAGWRAFTNRAGNNRVGAPPGFRARTRQRYNATVIEEQGGARRVFTVRSQNPSAPLPQASRDYRAWHDGTSPASARSATPRTRPTPLARAPVVFGYVVDWDGRRNLRSATSTSRAGPGATTSRSSSRPTAGTSPRAWPTSSSRPSDPSATGPAAGS